MSNHRFTALGRVDVRGQDGPFSRASVDVVGAEYNFEVRNASFAVANGAKKTVELAPIGDKQNLPTPVAEHLCRKRAAESHLRNQLQESQHSGGGNRI